MTTEFKKLIRKTRKEQFPSTLEFVNLAFHRKKLDKQEPEYFFENASTIIESIRDYNWELFLEYENKFSEDLYKTLIRNDVEKLNPRYAVEDYIEQNTDNFYDLSLSNTQSRRTRAGGEFEAILSHIFIGADLPFEEQGLIGSGIFSDKHLSKLVDHVIPGAVEYDIRKKNTIAISAKTTLRERWQQIGDEMQRTRMPEIYLATLDKDIGANTLEQLNNNNIYPVTTKNIKSKYYDDKNIVITFEDLLKEMKNTTKKWTKNDYTDEQIESKKNSISKLIEKYKSNDFICNYLKRRLNFFE